MIEHLVLFKFKNDVNAQQKADMTEKLLAMKNEISEIKEISCGINFAERSQGFHFGLRVLFATKADLDVYAVHPKHLEVAEKTIKPSITDLIVLDYEY